MAENPHTPQPHEPSPLVTSAGPADPDVAVEVLALADRARDADGHPPLSDQTRVELRHGRQRWLGTVRTEEGELIAAAALVPEGAGGEGAVLELVVDPDARGHGNGSRLADLAERAVRERGLEATTGVWAHGMLPGSGELARRHRLVPVRELRRLRLAVEDVADLPRPEWPEGVRVRAFEPGRDEEAWLAVNRAAFADHPEQGRITREDLEDRMREDWFEAAGLLLAERTADGGLLAFHWTKVEDGLGEVYAVGVSPTAQGLGLGRAVTLAGLHHLMGRGVEAIDLYVDADNTAAVRLYDSLGFTLLAADAQYRHAPAG